jgi:hypothetical protein
LGIHFREPALPLAGIIDFVLNLLG